MFSKTELKILDALAAGTSLKKLAAQSGLKEETLSEAAEALLKKLDAASQPELPDKFRLLTGWANKPSDYSH